MAADDIKSLATDGSRDYYDLLGLSEGAGETEIRKAYRQTARKYHPDKVGADNVEAREKFHLVQIAYDILSDTSTKELYDQARRAKQQKSERDRAFDDRRRGFKEDLERRERAAERASGKRKRTDSEERYDQYLASLAADGKRRREEYVERLRKEAEDLDREEERRRQAAAAPSVNFSSAPAAIASEEDRTVKFRFPCTEDTKHITKDIVRSRFEKFGSIEDVVMMETKKKINGKKQPFMTGLIVFESIVGAYAAVTDFPKCSTSQPDDFSQFENVDWLRGKEPDCVPKLVWSSSRPGVPFFKSFKPASVPRAPDGRGVEGEAAREP